MDDDANMRESINDNLEVEGYEVAQAASGGRTSAQISARAVQQKQRPNFMPSP